MKKQVKKLVSTALAVTLTSSLWGMGVLAEDITVSAITPADDTTAVSVIEDISVTFSGEVDSTLLTKENFSVTSEGTVPDYEIQKNGNTVKLNFADEFDYDTDYTVTLKNVGEEQSFNFTTESNPLTTLFEEDFSTLTTITDRFTNTGRQSGNGHIFSIDTTGKSLKISGYWSKSVGNGPIATIKGSEDWVDYEVYGEFKNRPETLGVIGLRQTVDTTTASNQTNDGYFISAGSYYSAIADSTGMTLDLTKAKTSYLEPAFASASEHPAVSDESFYGVTVSVDGNKIDASTTNLATGEVMNSISYTDADNTYKKGALGFGALNTFSYWDNIKVTDKGLLFTPDEIKNTGSTITLNFNEAINEESVTNDKVTVKKGDEIVASAVEVADDKTVEIAIASPELDTEYSITVSKDILRTSDGLGMSTDKTFKVLTSENESDVEIPEVTIPVVLSETTPADGAEDISIFADPVLTFSTELDENSLSGKIAVTSESGSTPSFTVIKDGNNAVVKFEKELDYETTYTVVVNSGIQNIYGGVLSAGKSFSFTTERNEMLVLFEEDFNNITSLDGRFTNTGEQDHKFKVEGSSLSIGEHHEWKIGQGPIATIKGSENWTDYEVYGEFKTRQYASGVIAFRQQVDTSSASDQTGEGYFLRAGAYDRIYIDGVRTDANTMHLDLSEFDTNMTPYAYTDTYPTISNETMYGVTVKVEGSTINAYTTDLATGETLNTLSYTDAENKYAKGAIGFGTYYDFTYWDNIKVIDKGLMFTPSQMKNTSNSVNLIFNQAIAASSVTDDKITVKKGDTVVDSTVTAVNDTTVNIKIEDAEVSTLYTITVSKDILRASDNLGMNSDKTFEILTSSDGKALDPIEVLAVTPFDGTENASIFTDPAIRFTFAPTLESAKENISVTAANGTLPEYSIEVDGNDAIIRFEKELDYETAYTVTVNSGIKNESGAVISKGVTASFTTERNEMLVLFEEDFNNITSLDGRFTNTGEQDHRFKVEGSSLSIGEHHEWKIGQGPIATIKGSENWTDYEVYGEFKTRQYASGVIAFRQQVDTSSASDQTGEGYFLRAGAYDRIYIDGVRTDANTMHLDLSEFDTNMTPYAYTDTYPTISNETMYGVTVKVEGSTINAYTTDIATGETLNTLSYTDAENKYTKGAVGFGTYYDFTYWDNIKVIDKGFRFTPEQMKNVSGSFSLNFTEDVNKETLAGNIIVTDEDGNELKTRVTLNGNNKVDVVIDDAENGKTYTVTVKSAVANTDGDTMANDKVFNVTVALPFEVEDLYIADADGEVTELTANGTVKGVAKVSHFNGTQNYTVVIAVYDETGAMYDVLFAEKKMTANGSVTIETPEIKLPENVTGYKASVFLMDSLKNIQPLTGKVSIPN